MNYFLAGDLGGTKTVLALYRMDAGGCQLLRSRRFASSEHADLESLVAIFLAECPEAPILAAFGVAGPVVAGEARITNLGWSVSCRRLAARFHFAEVLLLNDLVALAEAVPSLGPEDLLVVNRGEPAPEGAMAILAPGTGLGEASLCWDGERYRAYPSEGGHADFAPLTLQQEELRRSLQAGFGHVSYETVCSGLGIPRIYTFLRETGGRGLPRLAAELVGVADPTPVLVRHALEHGCELCQEALSLFFSVLAAEAGNVALKFLATGGVFLGGGLLPRLLPLFDGSHFMEVFAGKGKMADLLWRMPVQIITRENTGLMGAAVAAHRRLSAGAGREARCR